MLKTRPGRVTRSRWWLAVASLSLLAACDDDAKDGTYLHTAGSSGTSNGGAGNGGGAAGGLAGSGGSGGSSDVDELDASTDADAAPDGAIRTNVCVLATLAEYCEVLACPALADVKTVLRAGADRYLEAIVQRRCSALNGATRIAVSARSLDWSRTFIYDATTEQLVGVEYSDDLASCVESEPSDPFFGKTSGFYGEAAPDCGKLEFDDAIKDNCRFDAGLAPDAGPYECVIDP